MNQGLSQQNRPLRLKDLPLKLQQKYKNSIVFQKQNKGSIRKFEFDADKLKKRKIDKQKTMQQKLEQFCINPTEQKYLNEVFVILSHGEECFSKVEIGEILKRMKLDLTNSQIQLMIWEFDEDLDKKISRKQFYTMYKKCMMDPAAAEPKKLFHLTQFLMYCKADKFTVTVEDTLELKYVRSLEQAKKTKQNVKDIFEDSIRMIFGEDYENQRDGVQKQITFEEYLYKINQKAIQKRKKEIQKIKAQLRYDH